jgi:enoyl-CoA hydratase/carnithine racemase
MTTDGVQVSTSDGIRWITFCRPTKLNALTVDDLRTATDLVNADVKAIVFTGTGDKAFSAGMHLDSFTDLTAQTARELITAVRDFLTAVRTAAVPTAAMINGYCLGAAFELALACDLRICVEGTKIGLPEVEVGIPSVVDAALLQQHVGLGLAREIILTGDLYPADQLGIMNRTVARDALRTATVDLLGRVTRHAPAVLASQKRLFEIWLNTPLTAGIDASVTEFASLFPLGQPGHKRS